MEQTRNRSLWIGLLALLIGALIGYWIGTINARPNTTNTGSTGVASSDSSKEQNDLLMALGEHAPLTTSTLRAEFRDDPDADAAAKALDNNSVAIADLVEARFNGTKNEFLDMWRKHIGFYQDYLAATQSNNTRNQQQAKQNLAGFADQISTFFANHDKQINKEELSNAFETHGNQVIAIIDALVDEDATKVYNTSHEAYIHMGDIANIINKQE